MNLIQAIIIALVEGLTEYLPISSTAHMIFTSSFMGIQDDAFVKMFQISIQFGAILAVVFEYRKLFFNVNNISFYLKLALAVIPALVLGYLFDDLIEKVLEKPVPIAIVMIIGGIILLFIDRIFKDAHIGSEKEINPARAFRIGVWQCLAMMPGVSRAAASIIGGMQQKLNRKTAAEFSFFLAVPTMLAVTTYSVFLKDWNDKGSLKKGFEMIVDSREHLTMFLIGNLLAFIVALVAVKYFVRLLNRYGFRPFGWYRILAGVMLLFCFI